MIIFLYFSIVSADQIHRLLLRDGSQKAVSYARVMPAGTNEIFLFHQKVGYLDKPFKLEYNIHIPLEVLEEF